MAGINQPQQSTQGIKLQDRQHEILSESALRLLFERSPDPILLIDGEEFVDCNQAAVEMLGYGGKNELLSTRPSELSPPLQPDGRSSFEKADEMIATALQRGSHRFEWVCARADGSVFPVEVLLTAITLEGRQILYSVWRDISRRKGAELDRSKAEEALRSQTEILTSVLNKEDAFRGGQSRVLEMIATGKPLAEVLTSLVLLIEAQSDEMLCSVLMLSDDGKHVRHGAAPSLPESYVRAVNGAPIGPKNGSCGTAMYLGKQVIVTDILEDPLWEDYRELATLSGLRACWSTPIISGMGKVLGSFAMYYRRPQTPTGSEARLTEVATHIAGIAIEHQRAEEELRASEERFAKAFNANPHPMSLATLDEGRIIEVNESFVTLSGYARPELIGRNSVEFIWDMPLSRGELIERVRERDVVRDLEVKIRTKSGASRVLLLSSLMVDIGGQHCLLSVSNDITERRRAEEQVNLLQAITMEVAVAPDVPSALEVVLRLVCQTTGWMLGQSWVPREDGAALECSPAWFTSAKGLEGFRLGSENNRFLPGVGLPGRVWSSKQAAWIRDVTLDPNFPRSVLAKEHGLKSALAIPILSGDEVIAVIEFFLPEPQDEDERWVKVITAVAAQLDLAIERKHAEEKLRRTQAELAHISRVTTMGELAASIAHEVNQPLGAIVGNADICLQWLNESHPDLQQLRDALGDIASDGRRASEVIARVRGLAKKNAPEKAPLDLSEVAREVLEIVGHEAQRKQVAIKSNLTAGLPKVDGDRVQLQQVLLNLVMNGIEAMNGVKGRKRELIVDTYRSKVGVVTAVCDCGIGIELGKAEQLFKPFHTTKSGGMGMGLAISRSIIEAHGGRLWVEPNQETGATFKFTLPLAELEYHDGKTAHGDHRRR